MCLVVFGICASQQGTLRHGNRTARWNSSECNSRERHKTWEWQCEHYESMKYKHRIQKRILCKWFPSRPPLMHCASSFCLCYDTFFIMINNWERRKRNNERALHDRAGDDGLKHETCRNLGRGFGYLLLMEILVHVPNKHFNIQCQRTASVLPSCTNLIFFRSQICFVRQFFGDERSFPAKLFSRWLLTHEDEFFNCCFSWYNNYFIILTGLEVIFLLWRNNIFLPSVMVIKSEFCHTKLPYQTLTTWS